MFSLLQYTPHPPPQLYSCKLFQPKIIQGEILNGDKITFQNKMHQGGIIAIDSNKMYRLNYDDVIEINISDRPLRVVVG